MSRVQHVQERKRRASLLRRTTGPPPAIVVCELVDERAPSMGPCSLSRRSTIPSDKKSAGLRPVSPIHRAVESLKPHRPTLFLHPQSAYDSRFLGTSPTCSSPARFHSCPSSPVLRSPMAIRVDTNCSSVDYSHLEIAMEVAEEVARLCDSPAPVPTDVPLVAAGLGQRTADSLKTWLDIRFDYSGHAYRLLDADFTAETLAHDILVHLPDHEHSQPLSGAIPISLGSRITPIATVPSDAVHTHAFIDSPKMTSPRESFARARAREKDLSITLSQSSEDRALPAKEPGTSKKSGFVVGLLAMGALFGQPSPSPATGGFNARFMSGDAATPPNTGLALDLPRTPYSASGFGGWYAPATSAVTRTHQGASYFAVPSPLSAFDGLSIVGHEDEELFWLSRASDGR